MGGGTGKRVGMAREYLKVQVWQVLNNVGIAGIRDR